MTLPVRDQGLLKEFPPRRGPQPLRLGPPLVHLLPGPLVLPDHPPDQVLFVAVHSASACCISAKSSSRSASADRYLTPTGGG